MSIRTVSQCTIYVIFFSDDIPVPVSNLCEPPSVKRTRDIDEAHVTELKDAIAKNPSMNFTKLAVNVELDNPEDFDKTKIGSYKLETI